MEKARRIIAWQPVLTDHQAYTYQALSHQIGFPIDAYVMVLEDLTRAAQGWQDTRVSSIRRHVIPANDAFKSCYRKLREHRNDIHLFGSAFERPVLILCLLAAAWLGVEFYIVSEPYSPKSFGYFSDKQRFLGKLKAAVRPALYWMYTHALRRRAAGLFAISRLALRQYADAGMPTAKLFPFGYFVPCEADVVRDNSTVPRTSLRLIFVGSLIQLKGLASLIHATRSILASGGDVSLAVYGPGEPTAFDFDDEKIRHCGQIAFGKAQAVIADYDLLVLPSHYDGWGVVVNEAICAGVPVVCSQQTGASMLLETYDVGLTFSSERVDELEAVLRMLLNDQNKLQRMRNSCAVAAEAIQPERAGAYMTAVIQALPEFKADVLSPWYVPRSSKSPE